MNLQLFGKRGGGGGSAADRAISKSSGGVITSAKPTQIDTIFRRRSSGFGSGSYDDHVLEASVDAKGNVRFSYAKGEFLETAPSNIKRPVRYNVVAGAKNGQTFNIDWSKVNSISGQTYDLRDQARKAGLKWDGKAKIWRR